MDPIANPYSPGAGSLPPELAGRDKVREQVRIAIARIRRGNSAKSVLMVGPRGVGKTVLLEQMRSDAEDSGAYTLRMEASESCSLPALLAPELQLVLLRLSRVEAAKDLAQRGLRALAGFAMALRSNGSDLEVSLDLHPEPGLADSGNLENDLTALLEEVGLAARHANTAVVLFIDEVQYLGNDQFAALSSALHRCAQSKLPLLVIGAGSPRLCGLAGNAKSYAERLFHFPVIGSLTSAEAELASVKPCTR